MRSLFLRTYLALIAVVLAGFLGAGAWHAATHEPRLDGLELPMPPAGPLAGPRPPPGRPPPGPWAMAGLLLGLGVVIALQLVPLERDLSHLAQAARRFGTGEHDARVDVRASSGAAELAASFNEMAAQITSLLEGQQELLLAVSHELRTPLNRVRFAVELLAGETDEAARENQAEALQHDLDELDELVADLLTWARLTAAPGRAAEPVDLGPLVAVLVDEARRTRRDVTVEAELAPGLEVSVDRGGLRRALSSLIQNALRHARSSVRITADRLEHSTRLLVDDDGPGIPVADRQRVLEPFVRLDAARTRDAGGAGLGLALARSLAEAHGGTIDIAEAPSGGARVVLTLPVG